MRYFILSLNAFYYFNILNYQFRKMMSSGNTTDDDSAPESISFKVAKNENIEQLQKIKEQVI